MEINIGTTTYEVELLTESGTLFDLTPALLHLQWEEEGNSLAVRGDILVANMALNGTWLMAIAKIGCVLLVYSNWGQGRTLVVQGKIWEWTYSSGVQKEISFSFYDDAKNLLQSYDYGYYSSGQDTKSIIGQICGDWGIPFSYDWAETMVHEKKIFHNESIADMILTLLDEVKEHSGANYVCHWKNGVLTAEGQGTNTDIFKFEPHNTISTRNKISIHDLVTKVKILGTADDEGRSSVEAVVEGDQEFGLMQRILVRDSDKTIGDAISEAESYMKEHNSPEEEIIVETSDLPFLRKGDQVAMRAGNLIGDFFVMGVTHNATKKTMSLSLEKI